MNLRKMIAPLFMALLAIGFFAGCASTDPIKTTPDIAGYRDCRTGRFQGSGVRRCTGSAAKSTR